MTSVKELRDNLNQLVNRHYETPEMLRFYSFPMTVARAKVMLVHQFHFKKPAASFGKAPEILSISTAPSGDRSPSFWKRSKGEKIPMEPCLLHRVLIGWRR